MPNFSGADPLKQWLHTAAGDLLELLYPVRCLRCHHLISASLIPLCAFCQSGLERVDSAQIGDHLARHPNASEKLAHIYAHWMFDKTGTVQQLHRALKYKNRPRLGFELGQLIGKALLDTIPRETRPDFITPIPLHKRRLYERGYNQSYQLASGIRAETNIGITDRLLIRSAYTETQTGLGQDARWENVSTAFSVTDPDVLRGRHVLVVDDILTTGATLLSAIHTLIEAGAREVSLAALAFARP